MFRLFLTTLRGSTEHPSCSGAPSVSLSLTGRTQWFLLVGSAGSRLFQDAQSERDLTLKTQTPGLQQISNLSPGAVSGSPYALAFHHPPSEFSPDCNLYRPRQREREREVMESLLKNSLNLTNNHLSHLLLAFSRYGAHHDRAGAPP